MGGWKQKSGCIQIPPASCVPFTFPFLSQLSVCLIVSLSRVCGPTLPLTNKDAFPDMAFRLPSLNLYIEIDKHCHRFYEASCDAVRLDTIQYGVKLAEGERLLPSILLRLNPHSTKDGGCAVPLLGRIKTLAQRYRNIVEASALDTRLPEFANMSVQYMFYESDVQHRLTLDRAEVTITVLDKINAECLKYYDEINKFQFADTAP